MRSQSVASQLSNFPTTNEKPACCIPRRPLFQQPMRSQHVDFQPQFSTTDEVSTWYLYTQFLAANGKPARGSRTRLSYSQWKARRVISRLNSQQLMRNQHVASQRQILNSQWEISSGHPKAARFQQLLLLLSPSCTLLECRSSQRIRPKTDSLVSRCGFPLTPSNRVQVWAQWPRRISGPLRAHPTSLGLLTPATAHSTASCCQQSIEKPVWGISITPARGISTTNF